jgi:hypothetical protein
MNNLGLDHGNVDLTCKHGEQQFNNGNLHTTDNHFLKLHKKWANEAGDRQQP